MLLRVFTQLTTRMRKVVIWWLQVLSCGVFVLTQIHTLLCCAMLGVSITDIRHKILR